MQWLNLINKIPNSLTQSLFLVVLIAFSKPTLAGQPEGSAYLDGGSNTSAVILAHGRGKHPQWKVVNPLRIGVHEALGFHTLSLQMPREATDWKSYANDFPRAYRQFSDAIRFLKKEKGVTRVFLMGHSMGSRMASAYVSEYQGKNLDGLIIAGCWNNGGRPLSCMKNMRGVKLPVLDIGGGNNRRDVEAAKERVGMVSEHYKQVSIPGASHKFDGRDSEFVAAVVAWLKSQ